jgi:hypothetical protein
MSATQQNLDLSSFIPENYCWPAAAFASLHREVATIWAQ